ncbi:MAG: acyl carrier protein [Candidatus Hydrogenedens sp.]|nr:acyl carrier protein [Candidatus Hydrogenedentota bacterium]NLF56863.1 acyl carrier protein [Candidatus Hydrogenedens sp.]
MAQDDDVTLRIKEIIADRLNRKIEELSESARIIDDLGADSLDQTEIIMALEEEYNLEIDDDANQIETVGDAIKYIKARV